MNKIVYLKYFWYKGWPFKNSRQTLAVISITFLGTFKESFHAIFIQLHWFPPLIKLASSLVLCGYNLYDLYMWSVLEAPSYPVFA